MSEQDLFPTIDEWLSDMDKSLADNLRRWAESEVMEKRLEHREDHAQLLEPAMQKLFVDIGLQKLLWPEKHGGDGHTGAEAAITLAVALEQIARADTGIAYLLANTVALQSCLALDGVGNDAACEALAGVFAGNKGIAIGSLVLPVYGSPQAAAKLQKGEWVVTGEKMRPLASGTDAAVFGVVCSLDDADELGLLVIPADNKGVKIGKPFLKTGLAASRNTDISLDGVKVPESACVARGAEAYAALRSWLNMGVSACCVGALFATYEILKEWGDTRVIKGKGQVFKNNPLTAALMADVARETTLARMLTVTLARFLGQPSVYGTAGSDRNAVAASMISQHVALAAEKSINNAMELMASAGYAREWNLERYWRDVKTMQASIGPDEISKMEFSRYFYQSQAV